MLVIISLIKGLTSEAMVEVTLISGKINVIKNPANPPYLKNWFSSQG